MKYVHLFIFGILFIGLQFLSASTVPSDGYVNPYNYAGNTPIKRSKTIKKKSDQNVKFQKIKRVLSFLSVKKALKKPAPEFKLLDVLLVLLIVVLLLMVLMLLDGLTRGLLSALLLIALLVILVLWLLGKI